MAAMLVGTGCSTDEVVNNYSEDNAIEFGTYVGRNAVSRATVIDNAALAEKGFGVYAYYTDNESFNKDASTPNFMYNQQVTGTANADGGYDWSYSPVKYWPNEEDDKLTFFAYAPYATDNNGITLSEETTAGYPSITYKMIVGTDATTQEQTIAIPTGDDVDGMVDVLYLTDASKVANLTKQAVDETVHFEFGHALSRVAFGARVMVDNTETEEDGSEEGTHATTETALASETTITINSVKLTGKFHTEGTMNLNTGEWTFDPATPTEEVSFVLDTDNFEENENAFTSAKMATTDLLNNEESYIMLFPQDLNETNTITITVDYDVVTKDDALDGKESKVNNVITSEPFYFTDGFTQGSAYRFVLHLGMTSVKVSAEVAEWNEEESIVVNVPINTTSADNQ